MILPGTRDTAYHSGTVLGIPGQVVGGHPNLLRSFCRHMDLAGIGEKVSRRSFYQTAIPYAAASERRYNDVFLCVYRQHGPDIFMHTIQCNLSQMCKLYWSCMHLAVKCALSTSAIMLRWCTDYGSV